MKLGFYFDMNKCIGCRTCQAACKDFHNLDVGVNYRIVRSYETGHYPNARMYHYSRACSHCSRAECIAVCPTGAMHYGEDGTVRQDRDLCIGCRSCMTGCPNGAPQYLEKEGRTGKCDGCMELRLQGKNPACVDACIMRCLEFGNLEALEEKYGAECVHELPVTPAAKLTDPSILIKPKACALEAEYKEIIL